MSQIDPFASFANAPTSCADDHFAITPDNDNDLPIKPMGIYCEGEGTIVVRDAGGVDLPYTMVAGQVLTLRPVRVLATGTTGTFYGWY